MIAGGLVLGILGSRRDDSEVKSPANPLARLSARPATLGGVLVLGGLGLLLRSTVLAAYSLGVAIVAGTDAINVEEPSPADLLSRDS
jgi:hypothetical protein